MLADFSEPDEVGVDEEEQDERDGHEIHVNAEEDSSVVEAPALLHAADGVCGSDEAAEGWQEQPWGRAQVGEVRDEGRERKADQHDEVATDE